MMNLGTRKKYSRRAKAAAALLAVSAVAAAVVVTRSMASDHQQTLLTEVNPGLDITDVHVFPGGMNNTSADRIVLSLMTSSPLTPAQTPSHGFRTDVLYQIKVDNNGDAFEDLVFQATFAGSGQNQTLSLRGPVQPNQRGTANTLVTSGPLLTGATNTILGSATGIQAFAGARDDPFFFDLEQFFRIIPDRKPEVTPPLSLLPNVPTATAFRGPNPPFAGGTPVDYLAGFNGNAIVIELPESMLAGPHGSRIGVWATTSLPATH